MTVRQYMIIIGCISVVIFFLERLLGLNTHFSLFPLMFFFPGFALLSLIKRQRINVLEQTVLSFTLTPVIIMIVFYLTAFLSKISFFNTVSLILVFISILTLIPAFIGSQRITKPAAYDVKVLLFLLTLSLFVIVPMSFLRVQKSFDGEIHIPLVYEVMNNSIPPEHFAISGYNVNTYWLYPAYLAVLGQVLNISPLFSSEILAFLTLFCTLYTGFLLGKLYFRTLKFQILVSLLIPFSPGFHHAIVFVFRIIKNPAIISNVFNTHPTNISNVSKIFPVDNRLYEMVHKFLSIDGFRIGFLLVLTILYLYIRSIFRKQKNIAEVSILFIAVTGLGIFHPTSYIPIPFLIIFASALFLFTKKISLRFFSLLSVLTIFSNGMLFAYIMQAQSSLGSFPSMSFRVYSLLDLGFTYILLLPFIYDGLKDFARENKFADATPVKLLLIILLFLAIGLLLPDDNQYKFVFLLSIPAGVLFVRGLEHSAFWLAKKYTLGIYIFVFVLCIMQYAFVIFTYTFSSWSKPAEFISSGKNIELKNKSLQKIYSWIRTNTETSSVIVSIPKDFLSSLYTQRKTYLSSSPELYIQKIPEYYIRLKRIDKIVQGEINLFDELAAIKKTVNDPLYVAISLNQIPPSLSSQLDQNKYPLKTKIVYKDSETTIFKIEGGKR